MKKFIYLVSAVFLFSIVSISAVSIKEERLTPAEIFVRPSEKLVQLTHRQSFTGYKDELLSRADIAALQKLKTGSKDIEEMTSRNEQVSRAKNIVLSKKIEKLLQIIKENEMNFSHILGSDETIIYSTANLSPEIVEIIVLAKEMRKDLQNTVGCMIDLNDLRKAPEHKMLNTIWNLSEFHNAQIDEALLQHVFQKHKSARTDHSKTMLIEGGGPISLLSALKLYAEGKKVILSEMRDEHYTRVQIVGIDPKWVAELNYYLGNEFQDLLSEGWAAVRPSGYCEVSINRLENALKARLSMFWSLEDSLGSQDLTLRYETEIKKIVEPENNDAKFAAIAGKRGSSDDDIAIPFDIIILGGGARDKIRDKYLAKAEPLSESRLYTVGVWTRAEPTRLNPKRSEEGYSGRFTMGQFNENLLRQLNEHQWQGTWKEAIAEKFFANELDSLEIQYRFFENNHQVYIGIEYPQAVAAILDDVKGLKKNDKLTDDEKAQIDGFVTEIDHAFRVTAGRNSHVDLLEKYVDPRSGVEKNMFLPVEKSFAQFPVALSAPKSQARVIIKGDVQALICVVGDALVSPHFFSGSGMSSGRESVNSLVESMNKEEDVTLQELAADIEAKQKQVIEFALERGKVYTPLLRISGILNDH